GPGMRRAECLGLRPGLESGVARPYGVRGVERVVFGFGPLQQLELDESRHLVEMRVARLPDPLEGGLRTFENAKAIQGDIHSTDLLMPCRKLCHSRTRARRTW